MWGRTRAQSAALAVLLRHQLQLEMLSYQENTDLGV